MGVKLCELGVQHRLKIFENRVLRKVYGRKRES
jgi:hypothetical protein